jgi:hypothetical protein
MKALRRDLVDPKITEHEGRIVDIRRGERRERVVCRESQPVDASTRGISIGSAGLVPLCQCALPLKQQEAPGELDHAAWAFSPRA